MIKLNNYYSDSAYGLNNQFKNRIKFPLKGISSAINWSLLYNPKFDYLPTVNVAIGRVMSISKAIDFFFIVGKLPEQIDRFWKDSSLENFRVICIASIRGIYSGCSAAKRLLPLAGRLLICVSLVGGVAGLLKGLNSVSIDLTEIYLGRDLTFSTLTRLAGDTLETTTAGLKLSILPSAPWIILLGDTAAFICTALAQLKQ